MDPPKVREGAEGLRVEGSEVREGQREGSQWLRVTHDGATGIHSFIVQCLTPWLLLLPFDHIRKSGNSEVMQQGTHFPRLYKSFMEASLVAQIIKNLCAMWKTWVQSLGQNDPWEKGMATHSSLLAWRIP